MKKPNTVLGSTVLILIMLTFLIIWLSFSGCSHYTEARKISKYNATIHTDYWEPTLYDEFDQCVLGEGLTDNLER